jgi:hypothetical protein
VVKNNRAYFSRVMLEKQMELWPSGACLAYEVTSPLGVNPYKYNARTCLWDLLQKVICTFCAISRPTWKCNDKGGATFCNYFEVLWEVKCHQHPQSLASVSLAIGEVMGDAFRMVPY